VFVESFPFSLKIRFSLFCAANKIKIAQTKYIFCQKIKNRLKIGGFTIA